MMSSGLARCLLALPVSPWLLRFSLGREQDGHWPGPAPQACDQGCVWHRAMFERPPMLGV